MRLVTAMILLATIYGALLASSRENREGLGKAAPQDIVEGTGTISLNALSADCSAANACACDVISVDGGGRLGPTNLGSGFMTQGTRVRFMARITGQAYCGPGFDIATYQVRVVDILEIEPQ